MYLAVDVGGTKTLLASFEEDGGSPIKEVRFETPPESYEEFLELFKQHLPELGVDKFSAAGIAIPGDVDRKNGIGIRYGNLFWVNTPVKSDVSAILNCPVFIENDAKAGGLSEALLIKNDFKKTLYVTLGTGIGIAYIEDGIIDTEYRDRGGLEVFVEKDGDPNVQWEAIVSGSAIKERYGKKATDITDVETWSLISNDLALGLKRLIGEKHPDAVVIGGGAGKHFERYGDLLKADLQKLGVNPLPAILPAKHAEEAVLYGCIDLIKQNNG